MWSATVHTLKSMGCREGEKSDKPVYAEAYCLFQTESDSMECQHVFPAAETSLFLSSHVSSTTGVRLTWALALFLQLGDIFSLACLLVAVSQALKQYLMGAKLSPTAGTT